MAAAFCLTALLAGIAIVSLRYQLRTWRRLRAESLASDDRKYLRGICQRRTLNGVLLLILAGMLSGAYLSGGQQELNRIAGLKLQDPPGERTAEDNEFVRSWAIYWIVVLVVLFAVIVIAVADYTATSQYARQQLRRIRDEQRTLLERDLAVYRQQKLNDRAKRLES
jgi:drug/metabolite transporter (DMT)-like permease